MESSCFGLSACAKGSEAKSKQGSNCGIVKTRWISQCVRISRRKARLLILEMILKGPANYYESFGPGIWDDRILYPWCRRNIESKVFFVKINSLMFLVIVDLRRYFCKCYRICYLYPYKFWWVRLTLISTKVSALGWNETVDYFVRWSSCWARLRIVDRALDKTHNSFPVSRIIKNS